MHSHATENRGTSLALIEGMLGNDPHAWEKLVDDYGSLIYYWARQTGLSPESSADIVQEVFRRVYMAIESFDATKPGATFRGWLWTITQNTVRDHLRREADRPAAAGGTSAQRLLNQVPAKEPDEATSYPEVQRQLHDCLDTVQRACSAQSWAAFSETVFQGKSSTDAAAELGMTANAVRHAKARVLRHVRAHLEAVGLADQLAD